MILIDSLDSSSQPTYLAHCPLTDGRSQRLLVPGWASQSERNSGEEEGGEEHSEGGAEGNMGRRVWAKRCQLSM